MEKIIFFLALIPPITILIVIISYIVYSIWYRKNYKTTEQTSEYDKGWNKCWDCKKVESEMYFYNHLFGKVYRCSNCAKCKQ